MSFGYAVGDVCAVLTLIERIAHEVRNYRNAPAHFQQLHVELSLMQNTIQYIIHMEPADDSEHANLQRIRAIAMHCLQPLQEFMTKMMAKESSLGHFRTTRSLSSFGTRLHWSMVTRVDVDDIRKIILSEMVAINMLLGMQQLTYLKKISLEPQQWKREASTTNCSGDILVQTSTILQIIRDMPKAFIDMRDSTVLHQSQQKRHLKQMDENLTVMTDNIKKVNVNMNLAVSLARQVSSQVSQTVLRLFSLILEIKKLVQLLLLCSGKLLHEVARNAQILLGLREKMRHIIRAIDAIPLHLNLDIIRLDDALGESWGLPFQACTQWHALKHILSQVVYGNGRTGSSLISAEMFIILSAQSGLVIPPSEWSHMAKAGMHVQQAMVISASIAQDQKDFCPYQLCGGALESRSVSEQLMLPRGRLCSNCGRWSMIEKETEDLIQLYKVSSPLIGGDPQFISGEASRRRSRQRSPTFAALPTLGNQDNNLTVFRRVQLYEYTKRVDSYEEAQEMLLRDPYNAPANLYMGWYLLVQSNPEAVNFLELSTRSDPYNSQGWYLLGYAYIQLNPTMDALNVYDCFEKALNLKRDCLDYWVSIAVLYYSTGQLHHSHESLSTAAGLNPNVWEPWYNFACLYAYSCQRIDAIDTVKICLDLNPTNLAAKELLRELLQLEEIVDPLVRSMMHCKLVHASHSTQIATESRDIDIQPFVFKPEICNVDEGGPSKHSKVAETPTDDKDEFEDEKIYHEKFNHNDEEEVREKIEEIGSEDEYIKDSEEGK